MLEIGKEYENRRGRYEVLALKPQKALIRYTGTGVTQLADPETLSRIHDNIQDERDIAMKEETKIQSTESFIQALIEHGAILSVRSDPKSFDKFVEEYWTETRELIDEYRTEVFVADNYRGFGFDIQFSSGVAFPLGHQKRMTHYMNVVSSKELGWMLIRRGFRIGRNEPKRKG